MTSSEKKAARRQESTALLAHLLCRLSDLKSGGIDISLDIREVQKVLELSASALFSCEERNLADPASLLHFSRVAACGVTAEQSGELEIGPESKLHSSLSQGKWELITAASSNQTEPPIWAGLESGSGDKGLATVVYPLIHDDLLCGLLVLSRNRERGGFSEEFLDLCQVIARMFAARLYLSRGLAAGLSLSWSQQVFESGPPAILVDRRNMSICRMNRAAAALNTAANSGALRPAEKAERESPVEREAKPGNGGNGGRGKGHSEREVGAAQGSGSGDGDARMLLSTWLDAPEFCQALSGQLKQDKAGTAAGEMAPFDLKKLGINRVYFSQQNAGKIVALYMVPGEGRERTAPAKLQARPVDDEAARRLSSERWLRQTICKLHASLDRDHLLQTLVDGLGRAFRTARCLVIRTDLQALPMVTHEYVEPDLSPLGLGRTGQFPMSTLRLFQQKAVVYSDISALAAAGQISYEELEELLDSGIVALAGVPLATQGVNYGVCVLLLCSGTAIGAAELETVELAASQAAVALSHSLSYQQAKDQLFHMNLLGNLTEQLTGALEATRRPGPAVRLKSDEKPSEDAPPLSSREMEVLCLIASGYANREIAQRLFLTESTVELHASRIRKKLNLKSRTALVKYACDNSLV